MQAANLTTNSPANFNCIYTPYNQNQIIESRQAALEFSKNNVSIRYIGESCSQRLETFLDDLTNVMGRFNFPLNTGLVVDDNKKIFEFTNEGAKDIPQLMSAYTDLCINDDGIISLPNSSFFVRNYAFEVN